MQSKACQNKNSFETDLIPSSSANMPLTRLLDK